MTLLTITRSASSSIFPLRSIRTLHFGNIRSSNIQLLSVTNDTGVSTFSIFAGALGTVVTLTRLYVESSVCTTPFPLTKADTVFSARCRRVMTLEYDGTVTPSTVTESESENIDSFIAFSADIASLTFAVSRSVFSLNEFILAIALVLLY